MMHIKTIENFLDKKECDEIINSTYDLLDGRIGSNKEINHTVRISKVGQIENETLKIKLLNELKNYIEIKGHDFHIKSPFNIIKYEKNGHYDWHTDYNPNSDLFNDRFISSVIQLNDEYDGGELLYKDFENNEIKFKRGLGNLFIFSSSILHKVTEVINGNRYSLVNWISLKEIADTKKTLI